MKNEQQALDLVRRAEATLADQRRRLAGAIRTALAADDAVTRAQADLEAQADRAFAGEPVTPDQVAGAHEAIRSTEVYRDFAEGLVGRFREPVARALEAVVEAKDLAWQPVAERGIALRIAAAARADRARLLGQAGVDTSPDDIARIEAARSALYAAAEPQFSEGTRLIEQACREGARVGMRLLRDAPVWPSSEERERKHWSRPLTVEEMTDAA